MRWLSIPEHNFILCWAYAEKISSYTESTTNKFSRMLSQRSNLDSFYIGHPNACWTNAETISSLAEHTRKRFHRWLSIRGIKVEYLGHHRIRLSKISCYRLQALKTIRIRLLQKKYFKTFHAYVPLNHCQWVCNIYTVVLKELSENALTTKQPVLGSPGQLLHRSGFKKLYDERDWKTPDWPS